MDFGTGNNQKAVLGQLPGSAARCDVDNMGGASNLWSARDRCL